MKLPSSRTRCWEQERDSQQPIAGASASWRVRRPLLWKFEEIHFTMSRKYSWENEWNTVKTNTIGIVQKLHLKEFKNNSWYTFEEKGLLLKEGIALNSHHKYCKCTFKNYTILLGELNLRVELLTKEWILPCMPTPVIHWWNIFRTQIWQVYSDLFVAPKTS